MVDEHDDDTLRRVLAAHPAPRLAEGFSHALMRRVSRQERERARQHGVGVRLTLGVYWLAALAASAWILKQGPLPEWAAAVMWVAVLLLVPAGYALVLWSGTAALANRERG